MWRGSEIDRFAQFYCGEIKWEKWNDKLIYDLQINWGFSKVEGISNILTTNCLM